jgi:hypothetical protein
MTRPAPMWARARVNARSRKCALERSLARANTNEEA